MPLREPGRHELEDVRADLLELARGAQATSYWTESAQATAGSGTPASRSAVPKRPVSRRWFTDGAAALLFGRQSGGNRRSPIRATDPLRSSF